MNKYLTEFIGTLFLVTVVGLSGKLGPLAPFAIGSILMVMVYAGGHISGAHYNPAVTLAVYIRGKITLGGALSYWLAQIGGTLAAWAIVKFFFEVEGTGLVSKIQDGHVAKAIAAEALGTFALAYVVLNVATAKDNTGNNFYGLAIGFTVLSCAFIFGPFSGGAFNPAVALGQSLLGFFQWSDIWMYLAGTLLGAFVAALVFVLNNPEDK